MLNETDAMKRATEVALKVHSGIKALTNAWNRNDAISATRIASDISLDLATFVGIALVTTGENTTTEEEGRIQEDKQDGVN